MLKSKKVHAQEPSNPQETLLAFERLTCSFIHSRSSLIKILLSEKLTKYYLIVAQRTTIYTSSAQRNVMHELYDFYIGKRQISLIPHFRVRSNETVHTFLSSSTLTVSKSMLFKFIIFRNSSLVHNTALQKI